MKKLLKKFKVLILSLFVTTMFVGVFAPQTTAHAFTKNYKLYEARENLWLNNSPNGSSPTGYKIKKGEVVLLVQKYSEATIKVQTLGGTGYVSRKDFKRVGNKNLKVPVCRQENGYYCGPATMQEVLKYYKVNKSQSTLASNLGTTRDGSVMTKMPGVLNRYQSKHKYKFYNYSSKADFEKKVILNIANGYPVVIDVYTRNHSKSWGYATSGHYMAISAYDLDKHTLTVADPHRSHYRTKSYSSDLVYNVVNEHWRQAIVY